MITLNPYLKFNDEKCREAMNFYQSILGGELSFQTIGESPMAAEVPAESRGKIMHAELKTQGVLLYASDMMMDKAVVGDNVGLTLTYSDLEEQKAHFDRLSEGGSVFMPLEKAFWGDMFGVVTDKYGVEWMLTCPLAK